MARRLTAKQRRARTFTVLALLIIVGLLVWWGVASWQSAADAPEPTGSPSPTPTESVVPSPSEEPSPTSSVNYDGLGPEGLPSDAPICALGDIELQSVTDSDSYSAGSDVGMSFTIVNTGAVPCQMNVGTTEQDYVIATGGETVFQYSDCATGRVDQVVTLQPDEARSATPIAWDRTYSDEESCDDDLGQVPAAGTTYTLTVYVAGIEAQGVRDFVLE